MSIDKVKQMFDYCKQPNMQIKTLGQLADFKLATDTNETLFEAVKSICEETKAEF